MRFKIALLVGALGLALFALPAAGAPNQASSKLYIVQMLDTPAVSYAGGIQGLAATKPAKGQKIDPNSANVRRYVDHLVTKHDAALQRVGGGKKLYSYGITFNGFAAELTEGQAATLETMKNVVAVTAEEKLELDTSSTPDFLGLTASGGLWEQLGGTGATRNAGPNTRGAGENVIIGIVDSGIWPEHPSVSDRNASGQLVFRQIPGWHGKCTPGERFDGSNCNQKLIGAQFYNAGQGGNDGVKAQFPWEYNSPRDHNGHGTHTATTAGGNASVAATGAASLFGSISGMAPRARIAAYKACWDNLESGTCSSVDLVAAIDQAVADGVDVINYSISGSRTNFRDPVAISFLFAADAGVFVAASAGNSGPATSTVAHPGPWMTTVAAGTHNRNGVGSVTLGNGSTYAGASFASAVPSTPLIDSVDAVVSGGNATEAELCYPGSLDSAKVSGKIVLCKRGVIALVDKSAAVAEADGVGMVLYNDPAGATNTLALTHSVPTVHVVAASGLAIKAYIAAQGAAATASIAQATVVYDAPAPFTASFSSRGPLVAGAGDLLKPDVIAPGESILAGVAPPGNRDQLFDLYSGTSMSSPHVAGLAALLKHKHPSWSPMAIKSALMTTGYDVLDGPNTNPLVIFRQGAGHVRPNNAADPGLVFDSGFNDWLAFICNTQPSGLESLCASLWAAGYTTDPSDFNTAAIAIGALAGSQTVTRKVTNVSGQSESYTAAVAGMTGITTNVSSLGAVGAGETKTFTVTFTTAGAALNAYVGGQLTLTGNRGHVVRIPLVIRPVALAAPLEVTGNGSTLNYNVSFGYTGPFTATPRGLVPAATQGFAVDQDADQTWVTCDASQPGVDVIPVTIPAGTTVYRVGIYEDAITPTGTDLDLFVCQGSTLVGASSDGDSNEEVTFTFASPTGGPIPLTVHVHGWSTNGPSASGTFFEWAVPVTSAGNMTVTAPASATLGQTGQISLTFSGLTPATRYMGSVAYSGAAGMPNPTIVRIDTP